MKTLNGNAQSSRKGVVPKIVFDTKMEVVASTPEEFTRFIKADMAKMGEVIRSGSFSN
jgi:tripartite-type tricarboxylate transporter receptor subunit TctC